ncbi:MAG: enoyl-CoA hydratase/isomerase family protein [Chloroflexi bacterium]|nr:enoyl-CoA hydratase/isomerase family protein [Chloroflexota bacterium]
MEERDILLEVSDRVAWLMINRPQARNAIRSQTSIQLLGTLRELAERDDVGCVVIRGAGDVAFCAGHDLKELANRFRTGEMDEARRTGVMIQTIATHPKPTIAAVKGYVRGGGNWLAASCDIVIAAEDATFALPQINFGTFEIVPMVPIMRRVGRSKVLDLLLSADMINAREAKAIGYADRLLPVEGFWDAVRDVAQKIASRDPQAVKAGKEALNLLVDMDFTKAVRMAQQAHDLQALRREPATSSAQVERHLAGVRGSGSRK